MQSNYKRWIVAALPLAMACTVSAQGKVTDVSTRQIDGGIAVHIGGSDLAKPVTKWDNGALVVQFQADLGTKSRTWKPDAGGIRAISFSKEGHSVNVAIRPNGSKEPQVVKVGDGWLVFFEQGILDKITNYTQAPVQKAQQKAQPNFAPINGRDFKSKAVVTLNFVDTDIVQILKALAMQANVNVAMGPDVAGKVTINLDSVPVDEAMQMVTTLGGVRFAYINNTYVVASPSKFGDMVTNLSNRTDSPSETRVVPLYSREGNQVKVAIMKMVPPSTVDGKYELVLPSEKLSVTQGQVMASSQAAGPGGPGAGGPAAAGGNASASSITQTTDNAAGKDSGKKDDYVVLIGTPGRMESVEMAIKSLDAQICSTLGIKVGTSQAIVRRSYQPKGVLAEDLVKSLLGTDKSYNDVQLVATPGASISTQTIVLSGREADVDRVIGVLADIDRSQDSADTVWEVVGLRYIRPNFAKVQVMQNVPGINAQYLPPPIDPNVGTSLTESANPGGGGSGSGGAAAGSGASAQSGGSGGPSTGGSAGSGGSAGGGGGSSFGGAASTSAQVQISDKSNSVPMKLLLRGTKDQIDAAKRYLAMVDLAPKQVAIELRVMEISREEALKVGLDWSVLTGGTLQSIRMNQNFSGDPSVTGNSSVGLKFPGGGTLSVLGALDQLSNKTNVLARPSILANDGVPTDMFVGDEVRYIKSIQSTQQGVTVETDEIDVGVDFKVTARVGDDSNIAVDLQPTLKVLESFTSVPGGGNLPQTSRRSASSQVSIKSGETIAIGGLIQDQDRKSKSGIPFLRDIPIIGYLFSRTNNDKIRTEVVFFVTVKEVTPGNRQGAANPNQAERDNTKWPGNKDGKKGG
ncbi:MAG: hypothetical protein ACHQ50_02230 [Fimbriimonadales bacterium]